MSQLSRTLFVAVFIIPFVRLFHSFIETLPVNLSVHMPVHTNT